MNVMDYTYLINKPDAITEMQVDALGTVLNEFPYFQSARALRLKGLHHQNSFKYNYALKVTAAHTTDRTVLFDFITSESFRAIQKDYYDKKLKDLLDITVFDSEIITPEEIKKVIEVGIDPIEYSILNSIKVATSVASEESIKIAEKDLEIGNPIAFKVNEKHSFQEWLQLSRIQPIDRTKDLSLNNLKEVAIEQAVESTIEKAPKPVAKEKIIEDQKKKKAKIIDQFIETNPKISPIKSGSPTVNIVFDINKEENSYLMTETLAKVYLEQKKYTKAIQAYEILILKYPEKISFFADRISDIQILQQNNN